MANTISVSVIRFHVTLDNVGHSDSDGDQLCGVILLCVAAPRYSGL